MQVSIASAKTRADVIAYLKTLGAAPAVTEATQSKSMTPLGTGPTGAELLGAANDREGWLYASKDYIGQRYAASTRSLRRMRRICDPCALSLNHRIDQSSPLVYRGTMYFTIDEATVAIDAATCQRALDLHLEMKDGALSKANRGVALKDGRLVRGTPDGYLIALNMADGSLFWSRKIADAGGQYLSMPPLIFEDAIIYGPAGADWGAKNWIGAFQPRYRRTDLALQPDSRLRRAGCRFVEGSEVADHGGGSLWTPLALDAVKASSTCRSAIPPRISSARQGPDRISIPIRGRPRRQDRQAEVVSPVRAPRTFMIGT